jgi:hypothetical protein
MPHKRHKNPVPATPSPGPRYLARTRGAMVVCIVVIAISATWSAGLLALELHLLSQTPAPLLGHLLRFVLPALIALQLYRYRDTLPALLAHDDEPTVEHLRRQSRFWIVVAVSLAAHLAWTLGYALYVGYVLEMERQQLAL